jgi:S1-C subfamily serine protease
MITYEQEKNILEQVVRPSVRINAKDATGSGTIVHSKEQDTYVLTNHHVVDKNIEYKEKVWDNILEKDVKKKFTSPVEVNAGRYDEAGHFLAAINCQADIITYNKERDLALLKLKDTIKYSVANLYPFEQAKNVPLFKHLICCGAALGEFPPCVTEGRLNGFQKEIDNFEYWLSGANSIFGNSGGGIFITIENNWYLLGVPARISVIPLGYGGSAVSHMGYFIPAFSVFEWFDDMCYQFIYNPEFTKEQCDKLREEKKEKELAMFMRKQG